MRPPKRHAFYVIIRDNDRKLFNIPGPMTDDTALTNQVWAAQQTGRSVNCSSTDDAMTPRDELIQEFERQHPDYTHTDDPIL